MKVTGSAQRSHLEALFGDTEMSINPAQPDRADYGALPEADSISSGGSDGDLLTGNRAHCHEKVGTHHGVDKTARRKLIVASVVCLLFMLGEMTGGILAQSLAIATDAAHLLTDFASFMISLFSIYLASRPPTKRMSFGWYRAEVMGALISVLLIWVVTGVLVYMAVERVQSGDFEIDAKIMLITAGIGVGVNIIMGCTLHDHGHSHGGHGHSHGGSKSHGHSHEKKKKQKRKSSETTVDETTRLTAGLTLSGEDPTGKVDAVIDMSSGDGQNLTKDKDSTENINVRAAFIHVIGDFVQSIGVFIAALIIFFKPEWKLADPICTFLFSVLVLITTITILRDTLNVLMEGTPRGISFNAVKEALCSIKGVKELHNLRIWSLTTAKAAVAVHLALESSANAQQVLTEAGRVMREEFGISECTIQVENYTSDMEDCTHCQDPQD